MTISMTISMTMHINDHINDYESMTIIVNQVFINITSSPKFQTQGAGP